MTPSTETWHTASAEETRALGAQLGSSLHGGEIVALIGELGAGKTTFTQGILQGMGSRDRVTSPTFTLVNLYRAGNLEVHHVDAYRLASIQPVASSHVATVSPDDLASLALDELIGDSNVVLLIEWADAAPSLFSQATHIIRFTATDDDHRTITLTHA